MKFIADAMLGKLARWLRFIGFDVLYYPDIDDRFIIRIAMEQDRTLLTMDSHLVKYKGLKNYIFIKSTDISEQFLEIKNKMDFHASDLPRRCAVCNGILDNVLQKNEIKELIPDFIFYNFDHFIKCRNCDKVYWEGSHYKKIKEKISFILKGTE